VFVYNDQLFCHYFNLFYVGYCLLAESYETINQYLCITHEKLLTKWLWLQYYVSMVFQVFPNPKWSVT